MAVRANYVRTQRQRRVRQPRAHLHRARQRGRISEPFIYCRYVFVLALLYAAPKGAGALFGCRVATRRLPRAGGMARSVIAVGAPGGAAVAVVEARSMPPGASLALAAYLMVSLAACTGQEASPQVLDLAILQTQGGQKLHAGMSSLHAFPS